jgi:glutamate/tyrosine decarboxylase-like PLP-dependent enzyme
MTAGSSDFEQPLEHAHHAALAWLESLKERPVTFQANADEILAELPVELQSESLDATAVVDELVRIVEPGLMAIPSGRFFGWVMGGSLPAALASDWLVSAWDQNAGLRFATPATAALEETAGRWLLDTLALPPTAEVGFTTGATMANFVGIVSARDHVLHTRGWSVAEHGLAGGPRVNVFAGAEVHFSVELALRNAGLGAPTRIPVDDQGRIRPEALSTALDAREGPTIVCLQAGNIHSGAFDSMAECIAVAHEHDAWVHVDGAFGLWAAASPALRHHLVGVDGADSWATDAHKTLNVPYDCGVVVVADTAALRAAFGGRTSYLIQADDGPLDPFERVPELSRRARGVPVFAALRQLGQSGVVALVDHLAATARALANQIGALPGVEVLNDVVFTQVCLTFGDDDRTRRVTQALIADGVVWMSGSRWQERDILRISVSNWSTDDEDVATATDAVRRAIAVADAAP